MQLGRYQVLKELAAGSVADVYLARAGGLEGFARHVVIKRIRPELATEERFVKAFLEEARISAALHHQNIVQVHDIGDEGGAYYFAMEYVHGEDVRKLINRVRERQEQVPLAHVLSIVMATAAGLHHAHEQLTPSGQSRDIVHRDVAPANILIGYDGSVKLVDFGLARAAQRSTNATKSGTMRGKSSYMSPEQCTGKPVDRRTDVFSLGIVLFELLTTQRLFKGATEFMTMAAIVDGQVPKPSSLRPDVPPALDEIVLRALARSPDARYQTAEAMRESLEAFALAAELRTSAKSLADYLVSIFGERQEPWLENAPPPDQFSESEATRTGVVHGPGNAGELVSRFNATAESPLRMAQEFTDDDEHEATAGQVPSLRQRERDLKQPAAPASSPGLYSQVRSPQRGEVTQVLPTDQVDRPGPAEQTQTQTRNVRPVKAGDVPGSSTVVEPPIFDGGFGGRADDDDGLDEDEPATEIALDAPEHIPDPPKEKVPLAQRKPTRPQPSDELPRENSGPPAPLRPAPRLAGTATHAAGPAPLPPAAPASPPIAPPVPAPPATTFAGVDPVSVAASFTPPRSSVDPSYPSVVSVPPADLASYQLRSSGSRVLVIAGAGIAVLVTGLLAMRSCGGESPRRAAAPAADARVDASAPPADAPPRPDAAVAPPADAGVASPPHDAGSAGSSATPTRRPPVRRPPKRPKVR